MTYSLCLSYINAKHFRTPIDIWANFIPGMVFFQGIFGYLVFAIIYKWWTDWPAAGMNPPSLLNMLIYMFLQPGTIDPDTRLFAGQGPLQVILLLVAVVQVPIMLFLKPFYLRREHNKARAQGYRGIGETTTISAVDDDDDQAHGDGQPNGRPSFANSDADGGAMITQDIGDSEHEEFEFSEVMIHQVIHTIGKIYLIEELSFTAVLTCHRILLEHGLAHSFLPASLGAFASTSATLASALEHDTRQRFRIRGRTRNLRHLCLLRRLVRSYHRRFSGHGRYQRYVALSTSALGGGHEQTFHRRGRCVRAVQFQDNAGGWNDGIEVVM